MQMMLAFGIQLAGQISAIAIFAASDPDYYRDNGGMEKAIQTYKDEEGFSSGLENTILFVFINNMYTISMITFNIAKPWRDYFFKNIFLMIGIILTLAYNQIVFFWRDGTFKKHYVSVLD